jgi:hypothetical protein
MYYVFRNLNTVRHWLSLDAMLAQAEGLYFDISAVAGDDKRTRRDALWKSHFLDMLKLLGQTWEQLSAGPNPRATIHRYTEQDLCLFTANLPKQVSLPADIRAAIAELLAKRRTLPE